MNFTICTPHRIIDSVSSIEYNTETLHVIVQTYINTHPRTYNSLIEVFINFYVRTYISSVYKLQYIYYIPLHYMKEESNTSGCSVCGQRSPHQKGFCSGNPQH